jgi:hypothetical protein
MNISNQINYQISSLEADIVMFRDQKIAATKQHDSSSISYLDGKIAGYCVAICNLEHFKNMAAVSNLL